MSNETESAPTFPLDDYDVVWRSPSADYNGSMPMGNGDVGANVWAEEGGDASALLADARQR